MRITHSFDDKGQNKSRLYRPFGFSWKNDVYRKLLELNNWEVCRSRHNIKPVQILKL